MIALPLWARLGAPAFVIALLVGWALMTRSMLVTTKAQRDAAVAEVSAFRQLATDATVPLGKDGKRPLLSTIDAKAALAGVFRDRDDARRELGDIDRKTVAAKKRADIGDAALAHTQAVNAHTFERAAPRIAQLAAAKPAGSASEDAAAIERDSRAAWEAWR